MTKMKKKVFLINESLKRFSQQKKIFHKKFLQNDLFAQCLVIYYEIFVYYGTPGTSLFNYFHLTLL